MAALSEVSIPESLVVCVYLYICIYIWIYIYIYIVSLSCRYRACSNVEDCVVIVMCQVICLLVHGGAMSMCVEQPIVECMCSYM